MFENILSDNTSNRQFPQTERKLKRALYIHNIKKKCEESISQAYDKLFAQLRLKHWKAEKKKRKTKAV